MKISMVVLNPFTHDARVLKEAESLTRQGHQVTEAKLPDGSIKLTVQVNGGAA